MSTPDIPWSDAMALREMMVRGEISVTQVVKNCLDVIEARDPHLKAFITVNGDASLERAQVLDSRAMSTVGPLHGLPIAVKDCMAVAGLPNTCGVQAWRRRRPAHTCEAVLALERAGAVVIGKTNLDESALGVTSSNAFYGTARNPWDVSRVPGGSSGGSAIAVATGMAAIGIGTDTGGSARIPASLCGVAAFKPTAHTISGRGVYRLSWSCDTVAPLARSVRDLHATVSVLRKRGFPDSFPPHSTAGKRASTRLGFVAESVGDHVEPTVVDGFSSALARLERDGARVIEVNLPCWDEIREAYRSVSRYEISRAHRTGRSIFGDEVQEIFRLGDSISTAMYLRALRAKRRIYRDIEAVLSDVDFLATPTTPIQAPLIGTRSIAWPDGHDQSLMEVLGSHTRHANLVGAPAITVPAPNVGGLPLGLQITARRGDDERLLQVGEWIEKEFEGWTPSP